MPRAARNRGKVRQTLDVLAYGTLDLLGLPRFPLPAEYIACVIVVFVQPVNIMTACRWMERAESAATMAGGAEIDPERAPVDQIFALCQMLYNDRDAAQARHQFRESTSRAMLWAETHGEPDSPD